MVLITQTEEKPMYEHQKTMAKDIIQFYKKIDVFNAAIKNYVADYIEVHKDTVKYGSQ